MHGHGQSGRSTRQDLRQRTDVQPDQGIGVDAAGPDRRSDVGVTQHGQSDLVELHVGRAPGGQVVELVHVDGAQVVEELLRSVVDAGLDGVGEAPEVHRRRRRQRHLGRLGGGAGQELELGPGDRAAPSEPRLDVGGGEGHLVPGVVPELERRRPDGQPVDRVDETVPVGGSPELAVGDGFETGILLERHRPPDRLVLGGQQALVVQGPLGMVAKR